MKTIGGWAVWGLLITACPALHAAAIYDTAADSSFAIGGPRTVSIGSLTGTIDLEGNAGAHRSSVASVAGVFPATRHVEVDGYAFSAPFSYSIATAQSGHFFTIDNPGEVAITIPFAFSFSWFVSLSIDAPEWEAATGGAFFHITDVDHATLRVEGSVVPDWLFNPTASTNAGQSGTSGFGSIGGSITVAPFTLASFSVITDTSGSAFSNVPEPGAFGLAGCGAVILGLARRRRVRKLS